MQRHRKQEAAQLSQDSRKSTWKGDSQRSGGWGRALRKRLFPKQRTGVMACQALLLLKGSGSSGEVACHHISLWRGWGRRQVAELG